MTKAIILTIDDEEQVRNAVERDLKRHFGKEYRIIKASSGSAALEAVRQIKERGQTVALFISDQRMPTMTGTEFLAEARKLGKDTINIGEQSTPVTQAIQGTSLKQAFHCSLVHRPEVSAAAQVFNGFELTAPTSLGHIRLNRSSPYILNRR